MFIYRGFVLIPALVVSPLFSLFYHIKITFIPATVIVPGAILPNMLESDLGFYSTEEEFRWSMHQKVCVTLIYTNGNPHSWRVIGIGDFLFFYSDCHCRDKSARRQMLMIYLCQNVNKTPKSQKQPSFKWRCGTKQLLFP